MLSCNFSIGQQDFWKFGSNSISEIGTVVTVGPSNEIYVGGQKNDSCLIVKLDIHGSIEWTRSFKLSNGTNMLNSLQVTSDGFLIGTAYTISSGSNPWGAMGYFKYDLNGNLIWSHKISSTHYIRNLVEKNATTYLSTLVNWVSASSSNHNFVTIEIDALTGNITTTYPNYDLTTSGLSNYLDDIYQTTPDLYNNRFYGAGRLYNGSGSSDKMRPFIVSIDQNGVVQWVKRYISTSSARIYSDFIFRDADTLMLSIYGDFSGSNLGVSKFGYIKTNINGIDLAQIYYDITGVASERLFGFCNVIDGYLFYGYTNPFSSGEQDLFFIKVKKDGDVVWAYKLGNVGATESVFNQTLSALFVSDSTAIFTGQSRNSASGPFDLIVGRINLNNPTQSSSCLSFVPINVTKTVLPAFNANPTFTSSILNVSSSIQLMSSTYLEGCESKISFPSDSIEINFPYNLSPDVFGSAPDGYIWNTGASSNSIAVNSEGWYVLEAFYDCCPSKIDSVYLFQQCVLNESLIVSSDTVCVGEAVTISTSNGSYNYNWSTGETTSFITFSPTNDTIIHLDYGIGSCNSTLTQFIDVFQNNVSISGPTSVCIGSQVSLTADGATDFVWNDFSTLDSIDLIVLDTMNISVIGSQNGYCPDTAIHTIIALPPINEGLQSSNDTVCLGDVVFLNAINGSYNYLWNTGEINDSIQLNPMGDSTVILFVDNGFCFDTLQQNIIVYNSNSLISGNTQVCEGTQNIYIASGAQDFVWSNLSINDSIDLTFVDTTIIYVIGSTNGYCPDTSFLEINTIPFNHYQITGDTLLCNGETAILTATGNPPFIWNTNETTQTISVSPIETTLYFLTGSAFSNCSDTAFFNLEIIKPQSLSANFLTIPSQSCLDTLVVNSVFNGYGADSLVWNLGNGDFVFDDSILNYNYSLPGEYTVTLIAFEFECGYVDSIQQTFTLEIMPNFYELLIPNVFSPNDDGINDEYRIGYVGLPGVNAADDLENFNLQIFNRWGTLIFESSSSVSLWNGKIADDFASEGVYYYILKYTRDCFDSETVIKNGYFSLLRN